MWEQEIQDAAEFVPRLELEPSFSGSLYAERSSKMKREIMMEVILAMRIQVSNSREKLGRSNSRSGPCRNDDIELMYPNFGQPHLERATNLLTAISLTMTIPNTLSTTMALFHPCQCFQMQAGTAVVLT